MMTIVENITGITFGQTAYDDLLIAGSFILGLTAILIVIQVFRTIIERR